jgi:hypothetical protein
MRLPRGSAKISGIVNVNTVAAAATAANTIVSVWTFIERIRKSIIGGCF